MNQDLQLPSFVFQFINTLSPAQLLEWSLWIDENPQSEHDMNNFLCSALKEKYPEEYKKNFIEEDGERLNKCWVVS